MAENQTAEVTWAAGDVPVSARFDDPYYSMQDGLAETRHVFLDGNDLPARLRPGFHVAELGVGTGLNLLALARCAGETPIRYTGFEAYPMPQSDLARALAPFAGLSEWADRLVAQWRPGNVRIQVGAVDAEVIGGDARATLPAWGDQADAWFLDGFAPVRNPELWEPALLNAVFAHTASGGSFATYTAAGHVRRALQSAGFDVRRQPGFGRKRHMTTGRKD